MAQRFCHRHGLAHQFLRTSEQGVNQYMQGGVRRIVSQMWFTYWVAFSKWKTRREEGSIRGYRHPQNIYFRRNTHLIRKRHTQFRTTTSRFAVIAARYCHRVLQFR